MHIRNGAKKKKHLAGGVGPGATPSSRLRRYWRNFVRAVLVAEKIAIIIPSRMKGRGEGARSQQSLAPLFSALCSYVAARPLDRGLPKDLREIVCSRIQSVESIIPRVRVYEVDTVRKMRRCQRSAISLVSNCMKIPPATRRPGYLHSDISDMPRRKPHVAYLKKDRHHWNVITRNHSLGFVSPDNLSLLGAGDGP